MCHLLAEGYTSDRYKVYSRLQYTSVCRWMCAFCVCTHRSVQFSLAVHGEVEATVHPSNANQSHSKTDELQNTCTHTHYNTLLTTY